MADSRESRILHIDAGTEWRGGQRQLFLLAAEQRANGTEPLVAGQPGSRLVQRLRASGLASAAVRMRSRWDIVAVRRIRRLMTEWQPGVIHVHDARSLAIALTATVGVPGVAIVCTCRTMMKNKRSLRRAAVSGVTFIAPNADVRDLLLASGLPQAQVTSVGPIAQRQSATPPRRWRAECGWPDDTVVCGVIGTTSSRNSEALWKLIAAVPAATRHHLCLVVFGGASGHLDVNGVRVFGAGFVDNVPGAIAGCDIFASLSGPESMNTAVLDAMVAGVPPIAFGNGGAAEYVEHNKSGLLIDTGDVAAFAAALAALANDPARRRTLSTYGPGRALNFTASQAVERTEQVYKVALRRHTANTRAHGPQEGL